MPGDSGNRGRSRKATRLGKETISVVGVGIRERRKKLARNRHRRGSDKHEIKKKSNKGKTVVGIAAWVHDGGKYGEGVPGKQVANEKVRFQTDAFGRSAHALVSDGKVSYLLCSFVGWVTYAQYHASIGK